MKIEHDGKKFVILPTNKGNFNCIKTVIGNDIPFTDLRHWGSPYWRRAFAEVVARHKNTDVAVVLGRVPKKDLSNVLLFENCRVYTDINSSHFVSSATGEFLTVTAYHIVLEQKNLINVEDTNV
jgi:hypothetical protein